MALFLVKGSFFKGSRPGLGSAFEPPLLRGGGTRSVTEGFGSFAAAQGNALRGANAIIFGELFLSNYKYFDERIYYEYD